MATVVWLVQLNVTPATMPLIARFAQLGTPNRSYKMPKSTVTLSLGTNAYLVTPIAKTVISIRTDALPVLRVLDSGARNAWGHILANTKPESTMTINHF